jgi:co-chaperonin GroES (HSP10)
MTPFRPLKDRVFIKPDEAPTMTESGLHLSEHWKPEQTGTVVAVGTMAHPRADRARALATELGELNHATASEAADLLRELVHRQPQVKVGDWVIFSWQSGQELFVNDGAERYLVLKESDILAVVEGVMA